MGNFLQINTKWTVKERLEHSWDFGASTRVSEKTLFKAGVN